MTREPAAVLDDLRFLAGRWTGEGRLQGTPVTSRTTCRDAGDALDLWVELRRGASVVHEERVVFRRTPGGGVDCITHPPGGEPQTFTVAAAPEWGGWLISRRGLRWEMRRTAAGWEETFGRVRADGTAVADVVLRHVRDEETGS